MTKQKVIETLGFITKEEQLVTVFDHILPGTFVVETIAPYPGYHGKDLPEKRKAPEHILLATKKRWSGEELIRISQKVKKYSNIDFNATLGDFSAGNECFPCVRIRNIDSYDVIKEIQSWYESEGVEFARQKQVKDEGIIRLKKFFLLEEMNEYMYKDLDDPNMYYFEIPVLLSWKLFKTIALVAKHNLENHKFDAALGGLYRYKGLIDVVRIYDINCTPQQLATIRNAYLEAIKKYE